MVEVKEAQRAPGSLAAKARRRANPWVVFALLGGLLAAALVAGATIGPVPLAPLTLLRALLDHLPLVDLKPSATPVEETIFFAIRLPRVVSAALVGAALATAGALFQGLLRNPLADPYFIGTSAGAAVGATIALLLPFSAAVAGLGLIPLAAFVGALAAVMAVYTLAHTEGKAPAITLLLAGFVVSAMLIALMTLLITLNDRLQLNLRQLFTFLLGGFGASGWRPLAVVAPLILGSLLATRLYAHVLDAFAVGEEGAASLGVQVEQAKLIIIALGALLTAAAVTLSGLVGFVGLIVPHAVRMVLGPQHRTLLPASALAGASFLVAADILARTVLAPTEVPVGVITALLGAPFFLYLLRKGGKRYAF
ncbi:MAG: iron ABC transporter permease [Dehalococcoidia bacterium]|nr:iron ABC transporter permease [Dehalococcoidia bacterium]